MKKATAFVLLITQVCLSADLTSFVEKKREEMVKAKARKEHIINLLEMKRLDNQLEELNHREKINSINREKELIASKSVKVNIKGFIGNYVVSDFVYKDKEETPLGSIDIEKKKIGDYMMYTDRLFMLEFRPDQSSSLTSPITSPMMPQGIPSTQPQATLPPPPPLPPPPTPASR